MRLRLRRVTPPVAVILAIVLAVTAQLTTKVAAAPAGSVAGVDATSTSVPGDTTTAPATATTSTTSPSSTTIPGSSASVGPGTPFASDNPPAPDTTAAPFDTTSTVPPTTTTSVAATTTTLDPLLLVNLLNGLDGDVAQAQAVNDYLAARALAASVGSGQKVPASADAVLVEAAAAQLQAAAQQAAADKAYRDAEHKIAQVALQLYVGEQPPQAGTALVITPANRVAYVAGILTSEERKAKLAKADLAKATAAANLSRRQADDVVAARTAQLQAAALLAPGGASTNAGAAGSGASPGVPAGSGAFGAGAASDGSAGATTTVVVGQPSRTGLSLIAQQSPSILGTSVLTADELAGWYGSTGHQANTTVPVAELADDFVTVGALAGVRPDLAFAQTMVETGYLSFPSFGQVAVGDNNFAGIGACDSCARGYHFPDARTGVQAQMQLLHAYATTAQSFPGPLPGPFSVAGCCQTWMSLSGVWATNAQYGLAILTTYRSMVEWALAERRARARL